MCYKIMLFLLIKGNILLNIIGSRYISMLLTYILSALFVICCANLYRQTIVLHQKLPRSYTNDCLIQQCIYTRNLKAI